MARVTTVTKARKAQGTCGRCGDEIKAGDGYRHASPGFRARKMVRCLKPTCAFRQSELTTSKMAGVYAAIEAAESDLDAANNDQNADEIEEMCKSILSDCADGVDEVAAEYREAAEAWGETNGSYTPHEEWEQKADELTEWAEELRNVDDFPQADEFDSGVDEENDPDDEAGEKDESEYVNGVVMHAQEKLGECP